MLHLIFQLSTDTAVFHRIDRDDDVVFLENAVFKANKGSVMTEVLQEMLNNNVHLYVLNEDLETRGITKSELVSGVEVIDYSGFVALSEKNKTSCTWN